MNAVSSSAGIRIVEAPEAWLGRWDDHVEQSVNGTLFHLRRFLEYHGDRFGDAQRFLLVLDGDSLVAQVPVALLEDEAGSHLRTPYGASYGGFAFQRYPSFAQAQSIVDALLGWFESEGITRATITPPIAACSALPLDVVHFALLRSGFKSVNRDVSSVVALDPAVAVEAVLTSRARNGARKAQREGVVVRRGALSDLWSVMEATFARHGAQPTHTLAELEWLAHALPRPGLRRCGLLRGSARGRDRLLRHQPVRQ